MTSKRPMLWSAALLLIALTMAADALISYAQSGAALPSDINPDSRARLPYLQRKSLDEAGQKVFDVLPGRRQDGALGGPLAFAAYNPGGARALFDPPNAAVAGTLNGHVRELAILVACRETNYNLEWNAHEPTAAKEGVDPKVIDAVRNKGELTGLNEQCTTVIRLARRLYTARRVASTTCPTTGH